MERKVKNTGKYRKEIFNQIIIFFKINPQINNIIVTGDLNQDIRLAEVQQFFAEIGIQDVHHVCNKILLQQMNNAHIAGPRPIDAIAVTPNLMEYIEGCELFLFYQKPILLGPKMLSLFF